MAKGRIGRQRLLTGATAAATALATLGVYETSAYARTNDPITMVVPLAEGDGIKGTSALGVKASGVFIPCQFKGGPADDGVLSRWGAVGDTTKAIRCLQVTFRATITASGTDTSTYTLTTGGTGTASSGMTVDTSNANYIDIATGDVTTAGAGHFRIKTVAGGGHNVLDVAEVSTGSAWKTILATGNSSSVYLKGVASSGDRDIVKVTPSSYNLNGKTLIYTVDGGVQRTLTFSGTTKAVALADLKTQTSTGLTGRYATVAAGDFTATPNDLEIVAFTSDSSTFVIKSTGTANTDLGLSTGGDTNSAKRVNGQDSYYYSKDYTGGDYAVTLEENGPERVIVKVAGKLGATPFKAMNDEPGLSQTFAGGAIGEDHVLYEARYTFSRNSAYVGMDLLWRGSQYGSYGGCMRDCAIDEGGILLDPNFSGVGTKMAFYDANDSAGDFATPAQTWAAGTSYVYQKQTPSGTGYGFTLGQSGITWTGTTPTTYNEGWAIVEESADDRGLAVMSQFIKERAPHGFRYDGDFIKVELWPAAEGHIDANYNSRGYHILGGIQWYRWKGGVSLWSGAYNVATVRGLHQRLCVHPLIGHCGTKYYSSKAFWYLPPATLTRGVTDWDTAYGRSIDWKKAPVDDTVTSHDGRTLQETWDDRNNGNYTLYGWTTHGIWPSANVNSSNTYDPVLRMLHGWMVTGDARLYEKALIVADHNGFLTTHHTPTTTINTVPTPWIQHSETGLNSGGLQYATPNTLINEINLNMYKPVLYMLTGHEPWRTNVAGLVSTKRGGIHELLGQTYINGTNYYVQASRTLTWGIEDFLQIFLMQGDTTSLTYARNIAINGVVYSDRVATGLEVAPTQTTTIGNEGGLGHVPLRQNGGSTSDGPQYTVYTNFSYAGEAMVMAHEIGTWSRTAGYTVFSVDDLALIKTHLKQFSKYAFTGPDALSRNLADTMANITSLSRPVVRGGNKSGANTNIFGSSYNMRWATSGTIASARTVDGGVQRWAGDTGTASVTNGSDTVTFTDAIPMSMELGYFYVDADGASTAIRISAHTAGATTATLSSNYTGTTGSGKAFTIAAGAGAIQDAWIQSLDVLAYTAKLYKDEGDTTRSDYALTVCRDLFENIFLYAQPTGITRQWETPFAHSTRGTITLGFDTAAQQRKHGWMTRRAAHFYSWWENEGTP